MSFMRTFILTVAKCRLAAIRQSPFVSKKQKQNLLVGFVACRFVSTQNVTKNIEIICQDDQAPTIEKPFTADNPVDRPLLVLLEWLFAERKHAMKFANLYLEQGFDVLRVNVGASQLMWPVKGTRVVAKDLLRFLHENSGYPQTMIHGFSIGGYMWGEVLDYVHADREKYRPVIEKIVGQVWDSAADISEIALGTSKALFPNNKFMQTMVFKYMEYHMKTFHTQATQYYIRSSQLFHTNLVHSPALFFVSKSDPVGAISSNMRVRDSWDSLGTPTYVKIFEKSSHVGHFRKYPKEYVNELYTFLDRLNLIKNEEKILARLQN